MALFQQLGRVAERVVDIQKNQPQFKCQIQDELSFHFCSPLNLLEPVKTLGIVTKPASFLKQLRGQIGTVSCVVFSPDSQLLATANGDNIVRLWNIPSSEFHGQLTGHTNHVSSVAWSPRGDIIASGCDDPILILWDATSGLEQRKLAGHTGWVTSVAFSRDGRMLVSGSCPDAIVWDVESGNILVKLVHLSYVHSVCFSHDNQFVFTACHDCNVRMFDVADGLEVKKFIGHTHRVNSLALSFDGTMLASASNDNSISLWNAGSAQHLQQLDKHNGYVQSVAFSRNGKYIASGGFDKTVLIWNAPSFLSFFLISNK